MKFDIAIYIQNFILKKYKNILKSKIKYVLKIEKDKLDYELHQHIANPIIKSNDLHRG